MKAIILAAGRGSRMGDGTADNPKCLMKLWGKTLLEMCVGTIEKAGIKKEDIGIVTGYKKEKIVVDGITLFHNLEWETTNMFISLVKAGEWLRNEASIVCYSDIVFHESAIKKLINCKKEIAITYYSDFKELWNKRFENPLCDLETFKINKNNIITEIGEKPQSVDEVQGQYMGLLRFEPSGWKKIECAVKLPMKKTVEKLDMTTLLNHLISLGIEVYGIKTDELWLECDNLNDIKLYEEEYGGNKCE
jgi:choline kinase